MSKFDVLGIGNAIVDILSFVGEDIIAKSGLNKGAMTLIDEIQTNSIYQSLGQTTEVSGGSAGNTVAGIASLGGKAAYIGRVRNDPMGAAFTHDLNGVGVHFKSAHATEGKPTACCLVMVTPDAQRTMATYLGACTELDETFIDEQLIRESKVTYIEGYLWDQPKAKAAIRKAIKVAKGAGSKVSFTLSDPFCVGRHRDEFLELLKNVDIVFANEEEAKSLFQCETEEAIKQLGSLCETAIITLGAKGSVVVTNGNTEQIAAAKIDKLVDTTGAGDMYAAGFLYGYARGLAPKECGRLGSEAAANIIQQLGARPLKPLKETIAA